jgi:hypothetical protein
VTILDCPISDKRKGPAPQGQIPAAFLQEWMANRVKNKTHTHKGNHYFRAPFDEARVRNQSIWARDSGATAILLNWETLPCVPSRDVPMAHRYDDAFALAATIDTIRKVIDGPIQVYGPRFWNMHLNYIDPAHLWEIYRSCGVDADGYSVGVVGMGIEVAQSEIESKLRQTDAPLNVLTDGNQPDHVELALKFGLPVVRWYRPEDAADGGCEVTPKPIKQLDRMGKEYR